MDSPFPGPHCAQHESLDVCQIDEVSVGVVGSNSDVILVGLEVATESYEKRVLIRDQTAPETKRRLEAQLFLCDRIVYSKISL